MADALSRPGQVISTEWTLHQEVVDQLLRLWSCNVDAFATRLNYRLQSFFSPYQDPMALETDAFLQSWDHLEMYAFPPPAVVRRVLNKLMQSEGTRMTLIAPLWPQKEWFPDLLGLLVDSPRILPHRRDLLRQPHFHRFHRNLPALQLHAWRLSSGGRGSGATQRGQPVALPMLDGLPL